MQIDTVRDTINIHVGATFLGRDLARLQEAVRALGPFSRLEIDFEAVRQCDEAALAQLGTSLLSLDRGQVRFRGLSVEQWHMLIQLGVGR